VTTASQTTQAVDGRGADSLQARLRARARRSRLPLVALVEVTSRCNLRCVHCYVADHQQPELPLERLLLLMRELASAGCISVTLTGGEIGVRDDWHRIAAEVKRRRMVLSVLTNGTAFAAADLERLVALRPARVAVSLYGASDEEHDAVTQVPGSFARSIETIAALRAGGIACRISSVLMKQTIDGFPALVALAGELGCEFRFDPTVAPCDDGSTDVLALRVGAERLTEFYLNEIIASRSLEGRIARSPAPPPARPMGNCDAGLVSVFVASTGSVYPCMGLAPSLGSVVAAPFADVWWGAGAREHEKKMLGPLETCPECALLPYCTARCPRLAAVEDGDLCGPSTRACEIARLTVQMRQTILGVDEK